MANPTGRGGIDSPDFIESATPHENPVQISLSELAIRLGWPHVFERTGNVLYHDNFEFGVGDWVVNGDVAGDIPCVASRGLMVSPYSVKLILQNGEFSFSYMRKRVAYPYLTTYGVEVSFLPTAEFGSFDFGFTVFTGEYRYPCYAAWDDVGHRWMLFTDAGGYVEVATYQIDAWDNPVWHPVKIVANMVTKRYCRLMYDAEDLALSDYGINEVADTTAPHMMIYIGAYQAGTRTGDIYVDNVLLTINEPE